MNRPITSGHNKNEFAYNPRDIRTCQIVDGGEKGLRPYHFCSPTFTDYGNTLVYLGTGHIKQIKDTLIKERGPEVLHFWSLKVVEINI